MSYARDIAQYATRIAGNCREQKTITEEDAFRARVNAYATIGPAALKTIREPAWGV
jgi:hypothetical protein